MGWNYRVTKVLMPKIQELEPAMYGVREVYYEGGTDNRPQDWTANETGAHGTTREEIQEDLKRYLRAFTKPVLVISDEGKIVGEEPALGVLGLEKR